jgi:predicted nuclease with TOPRIM domain
MIEKRQTRAEYAMEKLPEIDAKISELVDKKAYIQSKLDTINKRLQERPVGKRRTPHNPANKTMYQHLLDLKSAWEKDPEGMYAQEVQQLNDLKVSTLEDKWRP